MATVIVQRGGMAAATIPGPFVVNHAASIVDRYIREGP